MKPKVFARIPQTGLGNCMLVWAHALVFAKINGIELVSGRWQRIRWGALIRGERKKRFYSGYFEETSYLTLLVLKIKMLFFSKSYDPPIQKVENRAGKFFIFIKRSPDRDLFKYLEPYEDYIRDEVIRNLKPAVRRKYEQCPSPEISIHVRRGDFKYGNPITPEGFFISAIEEIRRSENRNLPVTVFTDAKNEEIGKILSVGNISVSTNNEDILDMLQMSKSRYLVLSQSSTFSYWAAFLLGKGVVIMHPEDWQKHIKPNNRRYKEFRYFDERRIEFRRFLSDIGVRNSSD